MKLVEILARELEKWPVGAHVAVQDSDIDETIWYLPPKHQELTNSGGNWACESWFDILISEPSQLATDHATAIVTRADWEAERAKLKAPRANADGWVRHRGGKCPVDGEIKVETRQRGGQKVVDQARDFWWEHRGNNGDIMAYRIHKPAEQPQIKLVSGAEIICSPGEPLVSMEQADTMLAIRDRIRELDTQRAEVESTYQRQISEITQERESLVQKLAGEGLALVEVVVQPVEDMSDHRKWREGDLLTLVAGHISDTDFTSGNQYKFLRVDEWDEIVVIDDAGDENGYGVNSGMFKWHSRPAS